VSGLSLAQALERAKREGESGNFDAADKTLKAILAAVPGQPQALQMLGLIALEEGRNNMESALARLARIGIAPRQILDIGAYEGWWSRLARKVFPQAGILMIEAQDAKKSTLEAVAKEIGTAKVRIAALGAEAGREVEFLIPETPFGTTGSSIYAERTDFKRKASKVRLERLDDLVAGSPPAELLKLDVQGSELDILKGGPAALSAAQAVILEVSLLNYNEGAPLFADIVRFMDEQGFQLLDLVDLQRGKMSVLYQADAVFLRRGIAQFPNKVW
jgi:FkbM family methyltransferase